MKLLLDQGLPRSAAGILRDAGLDAVHTGECGLSTALDAKVLTAGRTQGRVIVTLDADFHATLALSGDIGPSVIRVRIEGLGARQLADLLRKVVRRCRADLGKGALVSVTPDQIRVRRLPIKFLRRRR
jgi:predicted nuclease of predicted toxin-antitoxin system